MLQLAEKIVNVTVSPGRVSDLESRGPGIDTWSRHIYSVLEQDTSHTVLNT